MANPVRLLLQNIMCPSKCYPLFVKTSSRSKHWDVKYRRLRAKKVIKVPLLDFDERRREDKMTIEEIRSHLKEKGIAPPRKWTERPILISSSGAFFEPYIPPEGDGKISVISSGGAKQKLESMEKKGKTYLALRKIRNFQYDFDVPTMANKAQEIYIKAHNALAEKNEDLMHELVTEKAFTEMMDNVKNKTVRWKFVQSLEPPRVVQLRCQNMITENSTFAQATVRFHMQQILAIYDRFGRLMHGSEERVKDVLEYVVFEKHLSNEYGEWRIHGKIIPDWMPPRDNILKTFIKPDMSTFDEEPSSEEKVDDETTEATGSKEQTPMLNPA